jgi:hypothetical protein
MLYYHPKIYSFNIRDEANFAEVEQAIVELVCMHPDHVTTDKIKVVCTKNRESGDGACGSATLSETRQEIAERPGMYHFDTLADSLSAHRVLQLAVPWPELGNT